MQTNLEPVTLNFKPLTLDPNPNSSFMPSSRAPRILHPKPSTQGITPGLGFWFKVGPGHVFQKGRYPYLSAASVTSWSIHAFWQKPETPKHPNRTLNATYTPTHPKPKTLYPTPGSCTQACPLRRPTRFH